MTRWTEEQLQENEAFRRSWQPESSFSEEDIPDQGPESILAGKIVKHCKEHGWPCQCFRQSKKAKGFLVPGLPDCIIALPQGVTLWLELKSETKDLRGNQKDMAQQLLYLGHKWYKLKSFKRYLEIVNANQM